MTWNLYLSIILFLGLLFFATAVGALVWASKRGQFKDFEAGSRVIFDEEEPEGRIQDTFPGKNKDSGASSSSAMYRRAEKGSARGENVY